MPMSPRNAAPGMRAFPIGRVRRMCNGRSIGIELVNPGHEFGYVPFTDKQIASLIDLADGILGASSYCAGARAGPFRCGAFAQNRSGRAVSLETSRRFRHRRMAETCSPAAQRSGADDAVLTGFRGQSCAPRLWRTAASGCAARGRRHRLSAPFPAVMRRRRSRSRMRGHSRSAACSLGCSQNRQRRGPNDYANRAAVKHAI